MPYPPLPSPPLPSPPLPFPPLPAGSTRISPPASDFDFEGVSLIDMALHRYTKRKADKLSDAQLIKQEQLEQLTATSDESRGSGSTTSLDGTATTPDRSYGALLRSYTRKSTTAMSGSEALDIPGHSGAVGEGRGYDLSLAVHLNYEVRSRQHAVACAAVAIFHVCHFVYCLAVLLGS